ncbi:MAG: ATP-dependent DNA helicase RecG [Hyphomicrobium sp.]
MRPFELAPLFTHIGSLDGIGPKIAKLLTKLFHQNPGASEPRLVDLLWHFPTGIIDRTSEPMLNECVLGSIATLQLRILKHTPPPRRNIKSPYRVSAEDATGKIDLVFFHIRQNYAEKLMPVGEIRYVSGRVEKYGEKLQITHPDYIVEEKKRSDIPILEPIYPLTAGITAKFIQKCIKVALQKIPDFVEWQDKNWLNERGWYSFKASIVHIHHPIRIDDISPLSPYWKRIAYDELLANQLALGLVRKSFKSIEGRSLKGTSKITTKILKNLPFLLTESQQKALDEIANDLSAPTRMLRLLQGDVGSGKTVVALLAMVIAVEGGAQATLMAPTEVLARQHYETLNTLTSETGLRIEILTGRDKGKARQAILGQLKSGFIDILVGTHAIFQEDVNFKDLALAVIDEQHRFGVHQRLALQMKGGKVGTNMLVMTATPIPRTLLMTHYGDLDISRLTEKPLGRRPILTKSLSNTLIDKLIDRIRSQLEKGAQTYWICPLIESSEKSELAAAEERYAYLCKLFGDQVGLIHGSLSPAKKDKVIQDFTDNKIKILVATTVIEVGVNVPNANIMIIEHAERFGLAQLHQLRGRVGRGQKESYCMLLYQEPLSQKANDRIKMLERTENGFEIAEKDLALRGGGEVLGARQSGLPEFRIAEIPDFLALISAARDDAKLILEIDPELISSRGKALRMLLYLFECDEAIRLFKYA